MTQPATSNQLPITSYQMLHYLTFSIIIDDIVFHDGQTAMGVLGGGGPQTAFGMRLWSDSVGVAGGMGHDFPQTALTWLDEMGIDRLGIHRYEEYPSLRAWQISEADGRRIQVWRIQGKAIPTQLALDFNRLPPTYQQPKGFHFGVHPESPNLEVVRRFREQGTVVSIEPFRDANRTLSDDELRGLLSAGQVFSPNLLEAESLVGSAPPDQLIARMVDAGAEVIALRMGPEGSLLHHVEQSEMIHIPAIATTVVDPTGAGNAYGGGFLVGWVETGDLRTAGYYGAVAASYMVEQIGLPPISTAWQERAQKDLARFI
ncbi:MAG: PfkB family carbohydrate kinase [Chloroflexota bacterium]